MTLRRWYWTLRNRMRGSNLWHGIGMRLLLLISPLAAICPGAIAQTAPTATPHLANATRQMLLPVVQQSHCQPVTGIVFAPGTGTVVATASDDETVRLWDLASRQLLAVCPQDGPIHYMAFSRDGQTLVTYGKGFLRFWNARTGRRINAYRLFTNTPPNPNACISDGTSVTTFVYRGSTEIWDITTGNRKRAIEWMPETFQRFGRPMQFTPDSKSLLFQKEELEEFDPTIVGARRFKLVTFELVDPLTGQSKRQLTPFEQRSDQGSGSLIAFATPGNGSTAGGETLWMAQAGDDGNAHLWNLRTGKAFPTLRGNGTPIRFLAFSPDGKRLITAGSPTTRDGTGNIDVWETATGKKIGTISSKPGWRPRLSAFTPDSQRLLVATEPVPPPPTEPGAYATKEEKAIEKAIEIESEILVWDLATNKMETTLEGPVKVASLTPSPDGSRVMAGEEGGGIRIWNTQSWKQVGLFPSARQLDSPSYSPDGSLLAVVAQNGYMQVWETATGRLKEVFPTNDAFGANARYLSTEPTFLPDGKAIVYAVPYRGSVERYDLNTRQRQVLYTIDPKAIVSGTTDSKTHIPVMRLQVSPDGKTLAMSMADAKTRLMNIESGKITQTLEYGFATFSEPGSGTDNGRGVQFTPDGKSLVALFESTIRIYDTTTGEIRKTVPTGRSQDCIRLSADGRLLAALLDREVHLYEVATGEMKAALKVTDGEYLFSIALSPDGKRVLTRGHQHLRVWEIETGQVVANMDTETLSSEAQSIVQSFASVAMAFSTDGKWVAICLPNNEAAVWNVMDGKRVAVTAASLGDMPPRFRYPVSLLASQLLMHDPRNGNLLATFTAFPALTFAEQERLRQTPDPRVWRERPFAWMAQTADGYYDASADIDTFLRWNRDGTLLTAEGLTSTYRDPDRLKRALRLETVITK